MPSPIESVPILACLDCWNGALGPSATLDDVLRDPRRFTVRLDDELVVHRRVMFDDHVVGAVCGDLYTHAGLVELGIGS